MKANAHSRPPETLTREQRKALRITTRRQPNANTHYGADNYMIECDYRTDTYHTQNLEYLDRGYDFDEFHDIDDELEGLTIVECSGDAELFTFCTGYEV